LSQNGAARAGGRSAGCRCVHQAARVRNQKAAPLIGVAFALLSVMVSTEVAPE
jgi:hypothetical protein